MFNSLGRGTWESVGHKLAWALVSYWLNMFLGESLLKGVGWAARSLMLRCFRQHRHFWSCLLLVCFFLTLTKSSSCTGQLCTHTVLVCLFTSVHTMTACLHYMSDDLGLKPLLTSVFAVFIVHLSLQLLRNLVILSAYSPWFKTHQPRVASDPRHSPKYAFSTQLGASGTRLALLHVETIHTLETLIVCQRSVIYQVVWSVLWF